MLSSAPFVGSFEKGSGGTLKFGVEEGRQPLNFAFPATANTIAFSTTGRITYRGVQGQAVPNFGTVTDRAKNGFLVRF